MNFKALFSTPKRTAAVLICLLAAAAAVGFGLAYVILAGPQPLDEEDGVIGSENAKNFAFADAGVDPAEAQAVHVAYERFEGDFVYSVEFIGGGTEYTYKINAGDGSVVRKESRMAAEPDSTVPLSAAITLEAAQEIALADAGVSREEAIFSRAEAGVSGVQSVYSFQFYAANVEYEYEINAGTGAVYSKKTVTYMGRDPGVTPSASLRPSAPAQTNPPTNSPDPTAESTQSATTQQPEPTQSLAPTPQPTDRPEGMYIGMSAAKSAALAHAGVTAGEAHFTQVGLNYENGTAVYALEFYTSTREYEYRIDARTGAVLSKKTAERSN